MVRVGPGIGFAGAKTTTENMKYIITIVLFALLIAICAQQKPGDVDDRTKELCREYAARDHEKEIAPERYKALGKKFFDEFDWYTSCINHTKYPVAK